MLTLYWVAMFTDNVNMVTCHDNITLRKGNVTIIMLYHVVWSNVWFLLCVCAILLVHSVCHLLQVYEGQLWKQKLS